MTFVLIGRPTASYAEPAAYVLYAPHNRRDVGIASDLFKEAFALPIQQGVVPAKIIATIGPTFHSVEIPGTLEYDVNSGSPKDVISPEVEDYLYPWLTSPKQWTVNRLQLNLYNKITSYTGTNSVTAHFDAIVQH